MTTVPSFLVEQTAIPQNIHGVVGEQIVHMLLGYRNFVVKHQPVVITYELGHLSFPLQTRPAISDAGS